MLRQTPVSVVPGFSQNHRNQLIVDNLSVHKHRKVKEYLKEREDRIFLYFTPAHTSWLNQKELWFSIFSRKILKRGIFNSKKELVCTL